MRYDTFNTAIQANKVADAKMVVKFMYKYIDDSTLTPHWRDSQIIPLSWRSGRKGTHILAWDVEADNWRRFAIVNTNEVEFHIEPWSPTEKFKEKTGA